MLVALTPKMLARLLKDLRDGVYEDFLGYFALGGITALAMFVLAWTGSDEGWWYLFLKEMRTTLVDINWRVLLVSIYVACSAIALRGHRRSPYDWEKYSVHPFLALASDASASAFGFFFVSLLLGLLPFSHDVQWLQSLYGVLYFLGASLAFWFARAVSLKHGNKRIHGTRSNPKFNEFPRVLKLLGYGGILVASLVLAVAMRIVQ